MYNTASDLCARRLTVEILYSVCNQRVPSFRAQRHVVCILDASRSCLGFVTLSVTVSDNLFRNPSQNKNMFDESLHKPKRTYALVYVTIQTLNFLVFRLIAV